MGIPRKSRLIVYCFAFILFLFLTVAAAIGQDWLLFLIGLVLTGLAVTFALVTGEWLVTRQGGGSTKPRRR
ncbi:hypothetical protein [Acrocarpospora catenulata]|uniref:hypothetical protein n=1 Tax=Acrocarpospora catenulata TaxID=2836182 RepID=UPI001BD9F88B|nr:hypothetical protein [Acrocarpospora catenulata]